MSTTRLSTPWPIRFATSPGQRDALGFLIQSIANEPAWFRDSHQNGWNQHSRRVAEWRAEVKNLGDLEQPLLRLVTAELRQELETRQSRNRQMYWRHSSYFWADKEQDFRRTAETVYAQRRHSGAAVKYVAEYLFNGLEHHHRAIESLLVAHQDEILDEDGQATLVRYLQLCNRHAEAIGVLQPMVQKWPDHLGYRCWLMHAYFRTDRKQELLALLLETDAYFHQQDRWNEAAMAQLGASCLENEQFAHSVAYYNEAISLHQRTQPNRGIGNRTLPEYYSQLARAHAGLGETVKAVDAASGAIVSWGPHQDGRREALDSLLHVLYQAPNLDSYVVYLNRQCRDEARPAGRS